MPNKKYLRPKKLQQNEGFRDEFRLFRVPIGRL
jgi:hypothetical protein